jgi:hypothetical protein
VEERSKQRVNIIKEEDEEEEEEKEGVEKLQFGRGIANMAYGSKDNGLIADASVINPSRFNTRVKNSPLQICPTNAGSNYPYSKLWLGHGKNDLAPLVNGWIEAMNASSPPSRCVKGDPFDNTSVDLQYRMWMVTLSNLYPSNLLC